MVAVVTAVTQQEPVLLVAPSTHQAEVEVDLGGGRGKQPQTTREVVTPRVPHGCHFNMNRQGNQPALTKLTSRVSLRGLILMAKAWALR